MFLTDEELKQLTGRQRAHAQRTVLNALGIQHKVRPDGSLVVLRSHVEKELGGVSGPGKAKKRTEPDWSAIK